jgi:hypothetical protein
MRVPRPIISLVLALCVAMARGQEQPCYRITHRVIVRTADGERHMGLLFGLNDSALVLLPWNAAHVVHSDTPADTFSVRLDHMERIALDGVDELAQGGRTGALVGGLIGVTVAFMLLDEDAENLVLAELLGPLIGSGVGWLVGASIGNIPEVVVKHHHGGPWTAEERELVHKRLPRRCDPEP